MRSSGAVTVAGGVTVGAAEADGAADAEGVADADGAAEGAADADPAALALALIDALGAALLTAAESAGFVASSPHAANVSEAAARAAPATPNELVAPVDRRAQKGHSAPRATWRRQREQGSRSSIERKASRPIRSRSSSDPMPRRLPLAPSTNASPSGAGDRARLPLLDEVRAVDRDATPSYVVWEITLKCDLGCIHCGSRAGKGRSNELSTDEALDFVDQMAALGVKEVSFIGGEVYLRDDWDRIARRAADHGMITSIVTGGKGFTKEIARRAKDAGVRGVGVSIDGLEETHDRLRGRKGSFAAALQALDNLREVGIPRAVNTQINTASQGEIEAVFDVVSTFGIYGWQTQFTVAMGRAADHAELLLQPWHLLEIMPRLAALKRRADDARIRFEPGNNVGYFGPYEELFRGKLWRGHTEPCTAGKHTMGVEANGDIKGCPSLPTADFTGGNIREHRLEEIWRRAPALRFTRARTTEDLWGFCATCYYKEACLAGCTWTSHVLSGKRGNQPYCHHRALELLEVGKRETITRALAAPGEPFDFGRFAIEEEPWPEDDLERARAEWLV